MVTPGPVPQSGLDGKFSVEYCAAVALLDGRVVIDSFTDQRRFAADMETMLRKIRVEPVEQKPGVVTVTAQLKDGRTVSDECSSFTGSVANPMNHEERMAKVWDCVGRALSASDASRAIALVENLEEVSDICTLMQIIGQSKPVAAS